MSHDDKLRNRPEDQPLPVKNEHPVIYDLIQADLDHSLANTLSMAIQGRLMAVKTLFVERRAIGEKRYGNALQPFNGRDALLDLLEELADATVYCRQVAFEDVQKPVAERLSVPAIRLYTELLLLTQTVQGLITERKKVDG